MEEKEKKEAGGSHRPSGGPTGPETNARGGI